MKYRFIFLFIIFVSMTSFSLLDVFYKKTYIYNDKIGNSNYKITWFIKKKKDFFIIDKKAENSSTNLIYTPSFMLKKFSYEYPIKKIEYTLTLDDKTLIAEGLNEGKKILIKNIIDYDWIQDFNFGLKNFLASKYSQKRFVIVNPKDFSVFEMNAFKKGIEKLRINNTTYKTQKIEISLPGFKSRFWKAQIWYDIETSDLIQYKANEGPGTSINIISLDSRS
jgi:hypothetical protein